MYDNVIRPKAWLDFNDAPNQIEIPDSPQQEGAKDAIKEILLGALPDVLTYLLPKGKRVGRKFVIGNTAGEPGDSLEIELTGEKKGVWCDHGNAAEGQTGGDILSLWAACHSMNARTQFPQVLESVKAWLGGMSDRYVNATPTPGEPNSDDWQPMKVPPTDELGMHTGMWVYHDMAGAEICRVYRYDPVDPKSGEVKKTYRQWFTRERRWSAPQDPRPLYRMPELANVGEVILVEGEKAADALWAIDMPATSALGGAKAPTDKTDWSPLAGKRVVIWPDKDKVGWEYAEKAGEAIMRAGAASVAILTPKEQWRDGTDVADLAAPHDPNGKGMGWTPDSIRAWVRSSTRKVAAALNPSSGYPGLAAISPARDMFRGAAKARQYLADGILPLGMVTLFSAMGDAGKGMMTLDLAIKVAAGAPSTAFGGEETAFGGPIKTMGKVVMYLGEDDSDTIHERLRNLDPGNRHCSNDNLKIVPLIDFGGAQPLVTMNKGQVSTTPFFDQIQRDLMAIEELKLVVIDPLQVFLQGDLTTDTTGAAYAMAQFARLARETGAAVIINHHMRKPANGKSVTTPEQAREAIRGTSALVDGVRCAYALWPAEESVARSILKIRDRCYSPNQVLHGAVVKANAKADRETRTYVRNEVGLLVDITHQLRGGRQSEELLMELMVDKIRHYAEAGHPFQHTGKDQGVYPNRKLLGQVLSKSSRDILEGIVRKLLASDRIRKCAARGSSVPKWLDVPGGPFARGVGRVKAGAPEPVEDARVDDGSDEE
ncbi:AAA family ATPase (plasmid) [Azospirillum oryzae]|uniref:AAA family ATPase n=1 Tax=Azospirillum oryzae TaxID=286727 RepID=A0A6N1AVG9_9PROT|nr:AAA family ATPase [Azospirillum oryzae]QKS54327.1 AAA family ATPase [Azospirillum oryzae]GLR78901.1 hypothetical protein GCM10007856_15750 [Azospirillum oryzae]